ncbi:hypothetical protein EFZ10_08670 [Tatumella sp. TA1]|nr:hypothetical protein EFZ10_08670 [Tatumella sp. TA1]
MKIEDYMRQYRRLPKLGRVVTVDMEVLRNWASGEGAVFDIETVVQRKVRRVMGDNGWRWQLVRDRLEQEYWDYYFAQDKEELHELNFEYGLLQ